MNARALLLADGMSDEPLGQHVARIAQRHDCELDVVAPDLSRLPESPGRAVDSRLRAILAFDDAFDLVVVHRDAERADPADRYREIAAGVAAVRDRMPILPIVPVRMTEAWLLVDESAIRLVSGHPEGRADLGLPDPGRVESVADPKRLLQQALIRASGARGRRLRALKRDFGGHRRRLLELLDHTGPVSSLSSWRALETAVGDAVATLS